jgi:hypothetical protein
LGRDKHRHFIQKVQYGGNIMRRKTPQNIFFCSQLAQIQPR